MIGGVLCYFLWRAWELLRTIRELRLRTISPTLLQQRLQVGKKVAVLDLLDVEGEEKCQGDPRDSWSGAHLSNAAAQLRQGSGTTDVQIVLYCSSSNQLTSARTALALRRKGISNVWVLQGGLKAWRELGLPVTTNLSSAADVAARFGIELPEKKTQAQGYAVT